MLAEKRRELILHTVRTGRGAEVVELARRFDVSEMTVRRDLARLAREGKLTRVHGGAMSDPEPPFAEIAVERLEEKRRIGRAAAALVTDGQTVIVDVGTTTLAARSPAARARAHGRDEQPGGDRGVAARAEDRARRDRRRRAAQLPLARRHARGGFASPALGGRCLSRGERHPRRSLRDGHDDGRGADQARDDLRLPTSRPPRRRGEVPDARIGADLRRGRARHRRHRRDGGGARRAALVRAGVEVVHA